jgi:very-short-patch-repair endonuclease
MDVFRLAGSPHSWLQDLMVGCLAWGSGTAVSHRSGAALWELEARHHGAVELTVPRSRRRAGPGLVHRHLLPAADVTTIGRIPVTTPSRTIIDLASVLPQDAVEEALDDALRRGMASIPSLRRRLAAIGRPGRKGTAMMRRLLESRDPSVAVPESVFERRLLHVFRRAGLPEPKLQHEIRSDGRLVAVVDFAYPQAILAIEADGYRWHSGRARWDHDRTRRNRLTLLGWRIIHVTWTDLTHHPDAVIEAVRTALTAAP